MRKVEFIMGMPITIDIPELEPQNTASDALGRTRSRSEGEDNGRLLKAAGPEGFENKVFDNVFKLFRQIDERFSPYNKESELSRFQRGEILEEDLSAEFKQIITACEQAEKMTDGYFSANFSGKFDPSGYVKGWAISEAGKVIKKSGFKMFCIGAGGDILAASNSDKVWKIGIQDPSNKQEIIETLAIKNGAVATSGDYERGAHIINPKTGKPNKKYLSVTITGPDIITADVLATAVFASGNLDFFRKFTDYKIFAIPSKP